MSLLYCASSVFCFYICFILLLHGPVFLTGKTSLIYLGHIVGGGELKIDPSKVKVILEWSRPSTVIEVRSFLGVAQYWRKFIANFSSIAAPLHAVTSVKKVFQWGGKK